LAQITTSAPSTLEITAAGGREGWQLAGRWDFLPCGSGQDGLSEPGLPHQPWQMFDDPGSGDGLWPAPAGCLFLFSTVAGIVMRLELGEPLEAAGLDLGDAVLAL
jgi:hypothetical protein